MRCGGACGGVGVAMSASKRLAGLFLVGWGLGACAPSGCATSSVEVAPPPQLAHTPSPAAPVPLPEEASPSPRRVQRGGGHAVEAAGQTPVDPAELDLPYPEILNPSRYVPGSMSLGTTASGSLAREAALPPEGEHHGVIPSCRERKTNFGTEELIELLMDAGRFVGEASPGSRLMVCNMAQQGGGDIKWSHSHNSGRDADLAFYARRGGDSVDAPGLQRFGGDLKEVGGKGGYTFDVARNWLLVKGILTHPRVQAQWLFISNPLKDALLRHAEAQGEPAELIERAKAVLWQPTDSSPHNDHLHLRVYCSREDVLEGCVNTGPVWAWVDTFEDARRARAKALARAFGDEEAGVRLKAIAFLERIEGTLASPELAAVIASDPSSRVREEALALLARWGRLTPEVLAGLERLIRQPGPGLEVDDPGFTLAAQEGEVVQVAAVGAGWPGGLGGAARRGEGRSAALLESAWRTLGVLGDGQAAPLIQAGLTSRRVIGEPGRRGIAEAGLAASAGRHVMDKRLIPPLIAALEREEPEVREAAARTLSRIANREVSDVRWGRKVKPEEQRRGVAAWQAWWREHQDEPREAWLLAGFREALGGSGKKGKKGKKGKAGSGEALRSLEGWDVVDALVPLTRREDHIGYNADRVITSITGRWSPREGSASARHARWQSWWKKNAPRLRSRGKR